MPFPIVVVTLTDGSQRTAARTTVSVDWLAIPDSVVSIRFLPEEDTQLYGDRFWAYAEGDNAVVFGARKPAQDVGDPPGSNPNEVPAHLVELVFSRQGQWTVRYPSVIPATGVKRWSYG